MSWFRKTGSDAAVVLRVRAGRRDEFAALVDRYLPAAHAVCYAQLRNVTDAEDAAQDAFIKAYEALDGLREPAKFGPWLLSIARNVCRNHQRSRAREAERIDALAALGQEPDSQPADQDLRPVVRAQIDALDAIHREVLLLHYYGGRSIKDIAALLELSPDAVKKRLQRAREALSARMLQHLEPAVAPQHAHKDRVKTIMGLLAGVTAAWEAGAMSTSGVAAGVGAAGVAGGVASSMVAKIVAGVAAAIAVTGAAMYWPEADEDASRAATPESAITQDAINLASTGTSVTDPTDRTDPSEQSDNPTTTPDGGYFIHGRTVDQAGNPVPGATVMIDAYEEGRGKHQETQSDEGGWFLFQDVTRRTFALQASGSNLYGVDEIRGAPKEDAESHTITMLPAGALEGVVVSKTGEPVPNARVTPTAGNWTDDEKYLSPRWQELRTVETDNNGRFAIAPIWQGTWKLTVDSPTYVINYTEPLDVVSSPVTITLVPGAHVEGRVVYAGTNTPVPDVEVSMATSRRTVTGPDGGFVFDGVNPGSNTVEIEHDTLMSLSKGFMVPEGDEVSGVEVEVVQGGIIEGRIYDAQTGEGILMADVRIQRESGDSIHIHPYSVQTNNEGEFRFTELLPGTYHVDYVDSSQYVPTINPDHEPLHVDNWKIITGVDFGLVKGAEIRGTIVGPPDALALSPMVSYRYLDEAKDARRSFGANARGEFRLTGLVPGEPVMLWAGRGKWKSAEAGPFTPGMDGIEGVMLTLLENPVGSVSGKLVYGNGLAVAQGDVELKQVDGSHFARAVADEQGAFNFENLPAGTYELRARAYHASLPELLPIRIAAGQAITGIVVDFGGGKEIIAGHVMDDTGTPIPGAEVRVRGPDFGGAPQTSGEHGEFSVQGLSPSSYDVSVRAEGYSPQRLKAIAASTHDLRVVLQRMGSIEGRAIDGQTGQPVTEFEIAVAPARSAAYDTGRSLPYRRFIHEEGAFRVDDLSPGSWVVIARAAGLFPDSAEVEVSPGRTTTVSELRLRPGAVANVTVVNVQGQPLQGAEVYPNGWPGFQLSPDKGSIKTNAEGLAILENLVPGTNRIFVAHSDYVPSQFELDVQAGSTLSPTFALEVGGSLEGVVTANGKPAPDAQIRLSYADADLPGFEHFHTEIRTDAQGKYRVESLVDGDAVVEVYGNHQSLSRTIAVTRAQTARADFNFQIGSATVTGTVRVPSDLPEFEQMTATLRLVTPEGTVRYSAVIGADGRFTFADVQPGPAELMVTGLTPEGLERAKIGELSIPSGGEVTRDFDFGQGATIQGAATVRSGNPNAYAVLVAGEIGVHSLNNAIYTSMLQQRMIGQTIVDASGRFQFDAVDPGEYTLIVVTDDLGETIGTPVTVREGETVVDVNVAFP